MGDAVARFVRDSIEEALTTLDVSGLREMTGLAVAWINAGCPHLQRLTMVELPALDDHGLEEIATLRALSAQLRAQTESLAEMWIALRRVVAA